MKKIMAGRLTPARSNSRMVVVVLLAGIALVLNASRPGAARPDDIRGWRGIEWGMMVPEVMAIHAGTRVLQRTKFQIGYCYFSHAVPVRFGDEDWDAWLCEDRDTGAINAVNIELGFRGGLFFGDSSSKLFQQFLDDLTLAYGPPQRMWAGCHNPLGNLMVQYRWYFPSTIITLLERDSARDWVMMRFERPTGRPEFGPGLCPSPPVDLP